MRLIDADALPRHGQRGGLVHWKDIENAPTVDAVEVVRCRECKYRETCEQIVWFDIGKYKAIGSNIDFCSYGERRE